MEKDQLVPGWGFYIDQVTQYLVEFSVDPDDWECSYHHQVITLPFYCHPWFNVVFRHERQHAFVYDWLCRRHRIFYWIWFYLFNRGLFHGFEELFVAWRSRSVRLSLRSWGNCLNLMYSVLVLIAIMLFILWAVDYYWI